VENGGLSCGEEKEGGGGLGNGEEGREVVRQEGDEKEGQGGGGGQRIAPLW